MSIVDWIAVDTKKLPDSKRRLLLSDRETVEIGGFFGEGCLTEGGNVPDDWMPTHYAEITLPESMQ